MSKSVVISRMAYAVAVGTIAVLFFYHAIFATMPALIAVQVIAFIVFLYARITFGRRSFHLSADPTPGGLVTAGPYRFLRHPIYAALIWFIWAGALSHASIAPIAAAAVCTLALAIRMVLEESELRKAYPNYAEYMSQTKRIIPFVV